MPLDELKSRNKVIGSKQVKKAVSQGMVRKVFIAADAEPHIIEPLRQLCSQNQVEIIMIETMQVLGQACGIEVGSATVALLIGEE
ncbi:MAG: ribosomal L7Ae/L30e/S12e/Gadd45 family protein [Syntrophomonas sp.]